MFQEIQELEHEILVSGMVQPEFSDKELESISYGSTTGDVALSICGAPTTLITHRPDYKRKINGKYIIPKNSIQIAKRVFVMKRPEPVAPCGGWSNWLDKKLNQFQKSNYYVWHPHTGLHKV